ncbi:MAG TPA: M28 family metallopeptidase [Bryobacteraceae bacterium]|nr:M28 family metallopeptidase [Bryobacteraceae bacterium]
MIRRFCMTAAVTAVLLASVPDGRRWWSHVQQLADDKLEGRGTGTAGYRKAAAYVSGEFERAGLKPAGTDGYFQPVHFHTRRLKENESSLELERNGESEELVLGEDAVISTRIDPAPTVEAPVVFAGYALTVPELQYDDLAGLDLRGKIVLYLSGGPSNIPGPLRSHYQTAAERGKFLARAGVTGTIVIPDPHHMDLPWQRIALGSRQPSMSLADPALTDQHGLKFAATVNPAQAEKWFAGSGHSFDDLLKLADAGKPLPRFPLHASIRASIAVERGEAESPNVAAILPGTDPVLKDQYVLLTAHLDHLGIGEPINGDRIYNGAMDNASGVATLLDIADSLNQAKPKLRRSLLFVAVTGEEKGLLGSRYFAAHPTVKPGSIVADLNVDMFLPLFPLHSVTVYGLNESDLGEDVRAVARARGVRIQDDLEPERNLFIRSDQYSFIRTGIPSLALKVGYEKGSPEEKIAKTWLKERYHAPADDLKQPVDLECAARFDDLVRALAENVADRPERPRWNPASFFRRFAQ